MKRQDLIPRAPRRMRQPRKDQLREALVQVTEENIRLKSELERERQRWWRRLWKRIAA